MSDKTNISKNSNQLVLGL